MKTLEEIIKQKPVYLHDWSESQKIGIISDFDDLYMTKAEYEAKEPPYANVQLWLEKKEKMRQSIERWESINILFATYTYENYSGEAWLLYEQNGKLYEVNGGHCSCYGLEGQFEPEDAVLKELENRLLNGTWGEDEYSGGSWKIDLCNFLGVAYNSNSED